jgi:DNA-binding MarR family transcriptional regulator
MPTSAPVGGQAAAEFELANSLAYRLVVLAERVSRAVAQDYEAEFHLSRPEWRVLAALAANGPMTAKALGPYSTLDKMQISRALQKLETHGHVERRAHATDGRSTVLSLTRAGQALYKRIKRRVQAREAEILGVLSAKERAALGDMIDRLRARVEGAAA